MNQFSIGGEYSRVRGVSDQIIITFRAIDWAFCKLSAVAFLVALIVLFVPAEVSAKDEDPVAHYRVLASKDLVAEAWKRPLLLSEEEISSFRIDPSTVVRALDQKLVAIPGYIRPAAVKEGRDGWRPVCIPNSRFRDHEVRLL